MFGFDTVALLVGRLMALGNGAGWVVWYQQHIGGAPVEGGRVGVVIDGSSPHRVIRVSARLARPPAGGLRADFVAGLDRSREYAVISRRSFRFEASRSDPSANENSPFRVRSTRGEGKYATVGKAADFLLPESCGVLAEFHGVPLWLMATRERSRD